MSGLPSLSIDLGWLRDSAARMLASNRAIRTDISGRMALYHAPSMAPDPALPFRKKYPHQWFWDSCAHAIILSRLDSRLARQEVESLLATQDDSGFIPHLIFNDDAVGWIDRRVTGLFFSSRSTYVQTPVLAEAVQAAARSGEDDGFLRRVLPSVKAFYRYLGRTRVLGHDGLAEIVHPYESGKDRSREYDPVYRNIKGRIPGLAPPVNLLVQHRAMGWDMERILTSNLFRVKDILFNCVYARNLSVLGELCQRVGEVDEGEIFIAHGLRVEGSIMGKMYDHQSGLFFSLDSRYGADWPLKVSTVSTFMPLTLGSIGQDRVERLVEEHLANPDEYWVKYPVPAEPVHSPEADRKRTAIWRGLQTWVYPNWFIVKGLLRQAERFPQHRERYLELAAHITHTTYQMIRGAGFREYYHSWTGKGMRAHNFGWSALVLDMAHRVREVVG